MLIGATNIFQYSDPIQEQQNAKTAPSYEVLVAVRLTPYTCQLNPVVHDTNLRNTNPQSLPFKTNHLQFLSYTSKADLTKSMYGSGRTCDKPNLDQTFTWFPFLEQKTKFGAQILGFTT
jgi:hypothetical protein